SMMGSTGLLVLDSLTFGAQLPDTSTGRFPDGSSFIRTFPSPTPGAANELPFSSLYINEFMASNSTGITDESGAFEDWIEIYNDGDDPVDIGGMYITDDLTNPTMWQIPATNPTLTTIPAKGFLVLWADKDVADGVLHVDIKLGAGGEQIGLVQVIGLDTGFVDSLTFGAQIDNVSEGRDPDGSSTFRKYYAPTPGAPNIVSFITGIYINEVLPVNTTSGTDNIGENDPWIEIYNSKDEPVNIGGLFLSDDSNNPTLWQIPDSLPGETTIPPKSFITLWADGQTSQGVLHLPAILDAGGGDIFLSEVIGPDTETTDSMSYPGLGSDVSYGRYPDGSSQFKSFSAPTTGGANVLPFITDVYINEFLAGNSVTNTDEAGEYDDWIELYNGGSSPVDVGGLFITDNLADANPYQIPTTDPSVTTIPPNGFLLLWADRQMSQGVLHVDIKLSGGGEQIGLIQINGDSTHFVDSLTFGPQFDDISRGRNGDGGPDFVSFSSPTPDAPNDYITPVAPFINDIYINEFMASNTVTLADSAGDYDDWIELYNAGTDSV
ncbi:MAG: lamin tail domain-containing protein, partial [Bacteroidetes bacterium]|nr:lamin tail domain-containing protein [Bacteroidota bacterium]